MNVWFYDLLNMFFPLNCQVCGKLLTRSEPVLCLGCEYKMPRANFTKNPENPVSQLFWGRTRILQTSSLFKFEKGSVYQALLHNLKYRGERRNGIYLGKLLGLELADTIFSSCDYIIPVPLHPKKLRKRGYNQAQIIARGVSSIIKTPILEDFLIRSSNTDTQTHRNRFDRFLNMEGKFEINSGTGLSVGNKLLLIDDIVTTGSTLEACSEVILKKITVDIFAATVAYA